MRFQIEGTAPLKCTVCGERLGEVRWVREVAVNSYISIWPWADICVKHDREKGCGLMSVVAEKPPDFKIVELS